MLGSVRWVANNGAMFKEKLREAASLLAHIIVIDMANINIETYLDHNLVTLKPVNSYKLKGSLIKQKNGYYILVMNNKELYAVNSDTFLILNK